MDHVNQQILAEVRQAEGARDLVETGSTEDGVRLYHGRILDELPGAAFAAMTLAWIISSFSKLVW